MMSAALQLPFSFAFAGEAGFDNFLASQSNAAVLAHLQHIEQSPGRLSWLWGEAGNLPAHAEVAGVRAAVSGLAAAQ